MPVRKSQRLYLISITLCAIFTLTSSQNTGLNNGFGGSLNNLGLVNGLGNGMDGLGLALPNLGLQNSPQLANQGLGYGLGGLGLGGLTGGNEGNYANNGANKIGTGIPAGNTNAAQVPSLQALGLNGLGPITQSAYAGVGPYGYTNAFNPGYGGYGGYPTGGMPYGMAGGMGNGMGGGMGNGMMNGFVPSYNPMAGYGAGYGNGFAPGLVSQQGYNNQLFDQFDD